MIYGNIFLLVTVLSLIWKKKMGFKEAFTS